MKEYTRTELVQALRQIGLKAGDVVLVSTELFNLGKLAEVRTKEEYHQVILDAIFEVIDPLKGTVVANAYTTQVGRYGTPFHLEKTPCTTGAFSQFIASHPKSIRSLHPINSVTALGAKQDAICRDVSRSNYGMGSPFERLLKMNVQILRLGLDYSHNVYMHFVEAFYGVPYYYHKLLDVPVFVQGKQVEGEFFAAVRHLEYPLIDDFSKLKNAIDQKKAVHSAPVGAGWIHRLDANEYCEIALELVKRNPYAFLAERPAFVKGVKPFDGITHGRDGIERAGNYKLAESN